HQDLALFAPAQQSLMRPIERFAVDILLEQSLAHHEPEILACATPGRIARLVDNMPQIVEPPRIRRLARSEPRLARLPALPCARGKAENLHFHPTALERAREDVRARGCDRDWASAHRARIVEQERDNGIAEASLLLVLEREWMQRIDDDAGKPRRIEQ